MMHIFRDWQIRAFKMLILMLLMYSSKSRFGYSDDVILYLSLYVVAVAVFFFLLLLLLLLCNLTYVERRFFIHLSFLHSSQQIFLIHLSYATNILLI
jgi:hypothetical protein